MNHAACLFVLLCCIADAGAQSPPADERGAYLSAELGNGRIHGDGASGERGMRGRAFEARVGRDLDPALLGATPLSRAQSTLRIDFVYANEGHPDNNHRDGFAFQLAWARQLAGGVTAELAAGPYTSMNTTRIHGVELDDARWGILYSAALRVPLPGFDPGTHVRLGFSHVAMRDTFQSNALMVGIGRHITDVPPFPDSGPARERLWLGASYGRAFTSHSGTQDANGATLEAKQYGGKWAVSFKAIVEGDDRTRVDRRGVAAQFWFVQPLTERWAASAGFGPYLAENRREHNRTGTHGLITLQFERNLGARNKAFFAFHRVKTFNQMNDRDLFHLGLLHGLGG